MIGVMLCGRRGAFPSASLGVDARETGDPAPASLVLGWESKDLLFGPLAIRENAGGALFFLL